MFRTIQVQFEPIDQWPEKPTANRKKSPFRASLQDTYRLLETELLHLGCKRLVIQADCERHMIRNDGLLRSDAKLRGGRLILSFDSKHGPLRYPCDKFINWDCNLRAIALSLEALRKVDRYGVTKRAEQYKGWAALPAPSALEFKNQSEALDFLRSVLGDELFAALSGSRDGLVRRAEVMSHPDKGGSPEVFKRVQAARKILLKGN